MEKIEQIIETIWKTKYLNSIIIIIISIVIYNGFAFLIKKNEESEKVFQSKKGKTYLKLLKSTIRYIFILLTILILLQINGINVSSMLAGVGVLSVIIGFAIQDALKDIIKGFTIISDSYYRVGDIIKFGDIEGKVLIVGLKTTKIQDVKTFNIISISNRNIEQVEVVSNLINLDIPLPYELKIIDAENVIKDIINLIEEIKSVDKCEYRGVNELADSSIKYQIKVYCNPSLKVQTRRDALRCVLIGLEQNGIQVPYNQIDVHTK